MALDVILRKAVEFGRVGLDCFLAVGNIAIEHRLLFGRLIVKFFKAGARGVVFVNASETKLEKLPLHVISCGGIGFGKIEAGKRVVHVMVEGNCGLRGAGLREHRRGVIAEGSLGMDLLHEPREISGGVILADSLVVQNQGIFNGARTFHGDQSIDRAPAGIQAVILNFFESRNVGL